MWAIRHKKTGRWVYGTDFRMQPHHQKTSEECALTFESSFDACVAFDSRDCSRTLYEVVEVRLTLVPKEENK